MVAAAITPFLCLIISILNALFRVFVDNVDLTIWDYSGIAFFAALAIYQVLDLFWSDIKKFLQSKIKGV